MMEKEKNTTAPYSGHDDSDADPGAIDYKNVALIKKFITIGGRTLSRRATGLTSKEQRKAAAEIKKLRFLGLLPYCDRHKK